MGMAAILATWPRLFEQTWIHTGFTCNLVTMSLSALQQMFESISLRDLEQRPNNDFDLWYSYVFMYSLSQLLVPTFNS